MMQLKLCSYIRSTVTGLNHVCTCGYLSDVHRVESSTVQLGHLKTGVLFLVYRDVGSNLGLV